MSVRQQSTSGCLTASDLYLENGYVDFKTIVDKCNVPFIFMVGARGIGKTYGAVDYAIDNDIHAFFMRRTQTQCDTISTTELCQVKPNYRDRGLYYNISPVAKGIYGIYDAEFDEEIEKYVNISSTPKFVNCALSTVYNIRGFDATDYTHIFYDEFIPEPHARPIKNEGEALLQAYETINRNRELQGKEAVRLICMANSNDLANPVFADLGLITPCDKIFREGKNIYINEERGVCVINFTRSPISEKKGKTALYRFIMGVGDYSDMALKNEFRNYRSRTKSLSLKRLIPIINVGQITIYRIKQGDGLYVSMHHIDANLKYEDNEKGLEGFRLHQWAKTLYMEYVSDAITFETYECEYLFKKYCGLTK